MYTDVKAGGVISATGVIYSGSDPCLNRYSTYTKTAVDAALAGKTSTANVYSKTEVDAAVGAKANAANVYIVTDVNTYLLCKVSTLNPTFYRHRSCRINLRCRMRVERK